MSTRRNRQAGFGPDMSGYRPAPGGIDWSKFFQSCNHYLNGLILAIKSAFGDKEGFQEWKRLDANMHPNSQQQSGPSAAQGNETVGPAVQARSAYVPLLMDTASANARQSFGAAAAGERPRPPEQEPVPGNAPETTPEAAPPGPNLLH